MHCMKPKRAGGTGWSAVFKKVTVALLMLSALLGNEPESGETMSPMEMLLFKIGFTALVDEFEQEKNTTRSNTERIARMEKNFELLVKFMEMTKGEMLQSGDRDAKPGGGYGIYNTDAMKKELSIILESYKNQMDRSREAELKSLRSEVAALKRDIRLLAQNRSAQSKPASVPKTKKSAAAASARYRVVVDEMNIRKERSAASKSLGTLKRDDIVTFESCDRFGWCVIKGTEGYVPKYLFLPAD